MVDISLSVVKSEKWKSGCDQHRSRTYDGYIRIQVETRVNGQANNTTTFT